MAVYERKFRSHKIQILQSALILVLVFFILLQFFNVKKMLECAKVINYAGIVRSGSQQLVKLEFFEQKNDVLITRIDSILRDLQDGGGSYHLMKLNDKIFQINVQNTANYWQELKNEILIFRDTGKEGTVLLQMSETFLSKSDNMAFAAQEFSKKLSTRQNILEIIMIVIIAANLVILGKQALDGIKYSKIAFIDSHTKLPNKSRCEDFLNDETPLGKSSGFIMFDLNYLKKVNDTLGHDAGDTMILNFATVLRKSVPQEHFVGRFGGDEFICILQNVSESEIKDIIENVNSEIKNFNEHSNQVDISFSYGYDFSGNYKEVTMKQLLQKADENMYEQKKKMHTLRESYNKLED